MDEAAVESVIEDYVKGVSTGDTELLARTFRDDARMWGYLGPDLLSEPIAEFFKVVEDSRKDMSWTEGFRHSIRSVEVNGRIAHGVLEEQGYLGADFVNHFTLVNDGERWRIATKTFTTV